MSRIRPRLGFTLVELSIVLVIIALVAGMGMVATLGAIEVARTSQTGSKMDAIEAALYAFRKQNGRLPCPGNARVTSSDSSYGKELVSGSACDTDSSKVYTITDGTTGYKTIEGGVPTRSLGLPDEYMFDGWGRRFAYAVDALAAIPLAFDIIPPQSQDCTITVTNAGNHNLTAGAIYALVSYGKNGHGGFVNGSTRLSTGVTNTHEQTNCHCNSSGVYVAPTSAKFVKRQVFDTSGSTSFTNATAYDDIVRYKERWQLQDADDFTKDPNYTDYQLGVRYSNLSNVYWYKRGCHGWSAPTNAYTTWTLGYRGFFTKDNHYFLGHGGGGCRYQAVYTNVLPSSVSISGCSTSVTSSDQATLADNGTFVVPYTVSPYVQIVKMSNTEDTPVTPAPKYTVVSDVFYKPTAATSDAPTAAPVALGVSRNATYIFLSDSSTYAFMYAKTNDGKYRKLASQPTVCGGTLTNIGTATFSRDGKYFAVACANSTPAVQLWTVGDGTPFNAAGTNPFTSIAPAALSALNFSNVAPKIVFSNDGSYFAAAAGAVTSSNNVSGNVKIYKIDASNTFTDISPTGTYTVDTTVLTTSNIAFTADNNFLLVPASYSGASAYGMVIVRRSSPTAYAFVSHDASPFYRAYSSYMLFVAPRN